MVVWEWVALEWMGTCISKKMNPIWWRKRCSWCPCCISLHIEFSSMWCFGLYLPLSKHWICQCLDYNRPPLLDTNANLCMSLRKNLHPLYRISKEMISLFIHYYKGDVLEYFPGLVDFTVKLNLNDKQRGALSKLQHFVGNRMSRDIMMLVLRDHVEWILGFSIGSKYLGSSLYASLYESYMGSPKPWLFISNIISSSSWNG